MLAVVLIYSQTDYQGHNRDQIKMGNCTTTPRESPSRSLDPECKGTRMWTTFLFSSLFTLFGGWLIILLYDFIKALVIKPRRMRLWAIIKRVSHMNEVGVEKWIVFLWSSATVAFSFLSDERAYLGRQVIDQIKRIRRITSVGYKQSKNGRIISSQVKRKWEKPWWDSSAEGAKTILCRSFHA